VYREIGYFPYKIKGIKMIDLKSRKLNRYKNYDYSANGSYFITICSKDMKQIFSTISMETVGAISNRPQSININVTQPHIAINSVGAISNRQCIGKSEISPTDIDHSEYLFLKGDNIVYPALKLKKLGMIVEETITSMSDTNNFYIDKYVIMPNHIHLIIFIDISTTAENDIDRRLEIAPTRMSIPNIVRYLKSTVTKQCNESIWQKSYYDHVIRNETEYNNISRYIIHNPINWINDEYYTEV
jgi:REP element-mobilizing transposase RayT